MAAVGIQPCGIKTGDSGILNDVASAGFEPDVFQFVEVLLGDLAFIREGPALHDVMRGKEKQIAVDGDSGRVEKGADGGVSAADKHVALDRSWAVDADAERPIAAAAGRIARVMYETEGVPGDGNWLLDHLV